MSDFQKRLVREGYCDERGAVFSFKNFLKVRPALDVIEEESRKQ